MLFCLSSDVYNDLTVLYEHDDCRYDSTNTTLLTGLVPYECKIVDRLSLITSAARHLRDTKNWQYNTLIARTWISSEHPFTSNIVDLNFKHENDDEGFWEYCYVSLGSKKILVSKSLYSNRISVRNGVPYYCIDDGLTADEYSLTEIAKSNQYFKLASVFPAEPRMFADDNVEYMIPYNLI